MTQTNTIYDVVVIGAGPAGFTAAMYTARRSLRTLVISKDIGGQAALTCEIENYPGVGLVEGPQLMQSFMKETMGFGAEFQTDEVVGIELIEDDVFEVSTKQATHQTHTVILAFGLTPRSLGIPGEQEFWRKGVSCTPALDVEKYAEKNVAVIGGGNSALVAADTLARVAQKVYLVHRRDQYRGESIMVERVRRHANIVEITNTIPVAIQGKKKVEALVIGPVDGKDDQTTLAVDGVFIHTGFVAQTKWLGDLVAYTDRSHIKIDAQNQTKTQGLFAAGDVTDIPYKQLIISAGEGAKAGLQAYEYIKQKKHLTGAHIDWGRMK